MFAFIHFCPTRVSEDMLGHRHYVADLILQCVSLQHQDVLHLTVFSLLSSLGPLF